MHYLQLKEKLEKEQEASREMTQEIERLKFERDAWVNDSRRLENEVSLSLLLLESSFFPEILERPIF